ncbi:hypothetical protein ACF0H5_022750 [Mactra antiquata]
MAHKIEKQKKRKDTSVTFDFTPARSPRFDNESIHCPTHSDIPLQLYCAFCKTPICERCKTTKHCAHLPEIKDYQELQKAAKHRRDLISKLIYDKQKNVIPMIKGKIVEISESRSKLVNRVYDVIRQYKDYTKRHWDKLKLSEFEWIDGIMYKSLKHQQLMEEKTIYLKEMLVHIRSTLLDIQEKVDESSTPEVFFSFGAWRSKLEFVLPPKWPRMEIIVDLQLEPVPSFGSKYFQDVRTRDKHCHVDFVNKIAEPLIYSKLFEMKLPIPKAAFMDVNAKMSISAADETFIAYGQYIIVYSQDNRGTTKSRDNIRYKRVVTVKFNIIDLTCCQDGNVFFLTKMSVHVLDPKNKISECFLLYSLPSAISATNENPSTLFVGFHDAGMIHKYSVNGELIMKLFHPDFRHLYMPRNMATNVRNEVVFSDGVSNITIIGVDGKLKAMFGNDVKTGNGHLRPSGVACASERHVFVIDNNPSTQLQIFDEHGTYLQTAVFRHLDNACALTIDRTGDIWIVCDDGRIKVYRPEFLTRD